MYKKIFQSVILLWVLVAQTAVAQEVFNQPVVIKQLKKHIGYLADDKLEGRRTGTRGEMLAAKYISKQFKKNKIAPAGTNQYHQPFTVHDGRSIDPSSLISMNGITLQANTDFFPLTLSGNGTFKGQAVWFDTKTFAAQLKDNPHLLMIEEVRKVGAKAESAGKALIVYNSGLISDELTWDPKSRITALSIPVIYLHQDAMRKYNIIPEQTPVQIKLQFKTLTRTGHNVVGFIDNGAEHTIVLGAHYDHLGYGEDKNSMYTGAVPMIHNGADDNASGTAAMLELSRMLKKSKFRKNNYLFVAFSGEELGLYGSRHFVENYAGVGNINYMINMDMVGRAADSARKLTIGGFGTSPVWGELIKKENCLFDLKIDSSGSGPSDHTSFYKKDIPVLFFFTGTHFDYHKPSDDADKISYFGTSEIVRYIYNLIGKTEPYGKLSFLKTKEPEMGRTSFKVTMGILIDYTFTGKGVYVDGVTDGRPASKAGVQRGDILQKMGDHTISDVSSYMQALNKFNKGETITIQVKRGDEDVLLQLTF